MASRKKYCGMCRQMKWGAVLLINLSGGSLWCPACVREYHKWRSEVSKQKLAALGRARPAHANIKHAHRAHQAVKAAVDRGELPNLKARRVKCTDCKKRAENYDHRDYGKPLDVAPVCRSCNIKRGAAIWPNEQQGDTANDPR